MNLDKINYLLPIYNPYSLNLKKVKGMYIYAKEGKFLDLFSSLATNSLGHRNCKILKSIRKQSRKYLHISNYFHNPQAEKFAKLLIESSFKGNVLFTNSGTEANEAALKIFKLYGNKYNKEKIFSLENSFHGRTFGSMSLTGQSKKNKKFGPLLENIKYLKFNNLEDLRQNIDDKTCGVFLELIQGESGINIVSREYITELLKLKEMYKFLIVVDEIQSGLMRTGLMFSYLHYKFTPDIITLAKSLGGGLPLGAVIVSEDLCDLINIGDHGSTFAPNPVAVASGYALFKEIRKFKYYHNINLMSDYLKFELNNLKKLYPRIIKDVRGMGLMIGVEVVGDIDFIKDKFFKSNILINITNKNIIRLLPAFIIKKRHIDSFLNCFKVILEELEVNEND